MQPWMVSLAAPLAGTAMRTAGQLAVTAAEPFAAALDRALSGPAADGSCDECSSSPASDLQNRVAEQLAALLGAQGIAPGQVEVSVDAASGELSFAGDPAAIDAIQRAVADDPQLRDELTELAKQSHESDGDADDHWGDFFRPFGQRAGGLAVKWDGAAVTVE